MRARFATQLTVKVWTRLLRSLQTPVAHPALPDVASLKLLRAGQALMVSGSLLSAGGFDSTMPSSE